MSKKVITAIGVATVLIGGAFGAKCYVNNQAVERYNAQIKKIEANSPGLSIATDDVEYNMFSDEFTLSGVTISSEHKETDITIESVKFTDLPKDGLMPENASFYVYGMEMDVSEFEPKSDSDRQLFQYLGGENNRVRLNIRGSEEVDVESNRVGFSTSAEVEKLGEISFTFNLDGVYSDISKAAKEDRLKELKKNVFGLLGKVAITDFVFTYKTDQLSDFIDFSSKEKGGDAVLSQLQRERSALSSEDEDALGEHFDNIIQAYTEKKDFSISLKVNESINQGSVMRLMIGDHSGTSKYEDVMNAFGIEVSSYVF